jgi:hypothetical protein
MILVRDFAQESGRFAAGDRGRNSATRIKGDTSAIIIISFPRSDPSRFRNKISQIGESGHVTDISQSTATNASTSSGSSITRAIVFAIRKNIMCLAVDRRNDHWIMSGFTAMTVMVMAIMVSMVAIMCKCTRGKSSKSK